MKTIKLFTLIAIIILAISCKRDDVNPGAPTQQISLRADGVLYSVTTGGAGVEQADAHINSSRFQLDATTADKDFSINFQPITGNGTYNAGNVALNFAQWEDGPNLYTTLLGTKSRLQFTITRQQASSLSDYFYVEGTFSGVLYNVTLTDSVRITEGQFKIL